MSTSIEHLLQIMATLRDSERGCPWDREQTFATIAPFTLEEAYEVADAIAREDFVDLQGELGDLLFQVVFYCQMAREQNRFDFEHVVQALCEKLITRHPHVFGDEKFHSVPDLHKQWEARKAQEREEKRGQKSRLDDVPLALPALTRAQKLQKRAASVGFDWPDSLGALQKVQEEIQELMAAQQNGDADAMEDELGDVLFSMVNVSRHLQQTAESALRRANHKFEQRFRCMETLMSADGLSANLLTAEQWERYWQRAKHHLSAE